MEDNKKREYCKPLVEVESKSINPVEAYSAAAGPVAAPAAGPVAAGGSAIVAAIYTKNC